MGWPGTGRPGTGRVAPPIGTPGCTGGGAGRRGALYTGRGPVCGTIMRGAGGGGGADGRAATGATGGVLAVTDGGGTTEGICAAGGGMSGRATGGAVGADVAGDIAGGATTARGGVTGIAGDTATGGAGVGATSFAGGGATVVGRLTPASGAATSFSGTCNTGGAAGRGAAGGGTASLRCVMAFSTSPGREMLDRSIFVLISSSPRMPRELDLVEEEVPSAEERMYTRTFSASCSSRELECVFFSVTPTSGSVSRMALLLTSSSRARSLIRTLLIRPFVSPRFS
jgi:hypothetical protein